MTYYPDSLYLFKTRRLGFKYMTEAHIDIGWLEWISDKSNLAYINEKNRNMSRIKLLEYLSQSEPPNVYFFATYLLKDNAYIGNIRLSDIDDFRSSATYGRIIGPNNLKGKKIGTEMLEGIKGFAFCCLKLKIIWTAVFSSNIASIRSNINAGMNIDHVKIIKDSSGKEKEATYFSYSDKKYKLQLNDHSFEVVRNSFW